MPKLGGKDIDNVTRLITRLPSDEASKMLKELKREKDPEGKRKIIEREMEKKGLKPL
jgi:hypothetical protein